MSHAARQSPQGDAEAASFQLRRLAFSVYIPTLLYAIGQGIAIPVVPLFAKDLGAGLALAGLVVTMRGVGSMVADVPAGLLVSRMGGRRSMLVGGISTALACVGIALSPNVLMLAAFVVVTGMGQAIWVVSRLAYIAGAAPVAQRGRAISLVGGASRIGTFVGPILGGAAASGFGLESAFLVQALVVGVGCVLPLLAGREAEVPTSVETAAHHRLGRTVREHWRSLLTAGSVAVLLTVLRSGRQILVPFWGDEIGLDVAAIGLIFGLSSAADMTLFYPVGVIMDRWGRKWAIIPSLLLLSVSLALIPLTHSFWPFLLVGLISGVGNGFGSGVVMTLGADLAPPDQAGEFIGVWRLIADIGAAGAPIGIGALAQVATLGAACVITAGTGFVGAAIMAFFVAETLQRDPTDSTASQPATQGGG